MKKVIIGINICSLFIIAHVGNWWNGLMFFIVAGIIPGTSYSLPPAIMISAFILLAAAIIVLALRLPYTSATVHTMPKRRYGRL